MCLNYFIVTLTIDKLDDSENSELTPLLQHPVTGKVLSITYVLQLGCGDTMIKVLTCFKICLDEVYKIHHKILHCCKPLKQLFESLSYLTTRRIYTLEQESCKGSLISTYTCKKRLNVDQWM